LNSCRGVLAANVGASVTGTEKIVDSGWHCQLEATAATVADA